MGLGCGHGVYFGLTKQILSQAVFYHRPHSRQVTGARYTGGGGSPVMSFWILLKANNAQQASGVGDKKCFSFKRTVQHLWTAIMRHHVNDITRQQVMRFDQWSKFANILLSWDLRKSHDSNVGRDSRETDSEFTVVHSHNVMQGFETVDSISFHVAYTVGIFFRSSMCFHVSHICSKILINSLTGTKCPHRLYHSPTY